MKLFDKDIVLQRYRCSGHLQRLQLSRPFVNLYVRVTDGCNAHCRFCCNEGNRGCSPFRLDKVIDSIKEINQSGIRLNRVCLTGGEPGIDVNMVNDIIQAIDSGHTQLQLNTNGLSADSRRLMKLDRIDVISVSLHHYQKDKLSEIFGTEVRDDFASFPGVDRRKLNVSCNLMRGYIDNADEVKKYLDFVASKGIRTVGFVSLMKVNEYCRDKFIDYSEIDFGSIPHLLLTRERHHGDNCKCRNYIYRAENGMMMEVYMRENLDPQYCASSLLFDLSLIHI